MLLNGLSLPLHSTFTIFNPIMHLLRYEYISSLTRILNNSSYQVTFQRTVIISPTFFLIVRDYGQKTYKELCKRNF